MEGEKWIGPKVEVKWTIFWLKNIKDYVLLI